MGVAYTTCPLCEATCGLEITMVGAEITARPRRRRRRAQPGLHLPEGRGARQLDADPDRLRTPLVKRDGGT